MRVYKLSHCELGGDVVIINPDDLLPYFTEAEIGEGFTVYISEMSQEEINKLPEFMGF